MGKVKKYTILVLVSIIATIMFLPTYSKAAGLDDILAGSVGVGGSVAVDASSLITRKDLYCIQHGKPFSGTHSFLVTRHIYIEGNMATENGVTTESKTNGALAYILSGGGNPGYMGYGSNFGVYNVAQLALYRYLGVWGYNYAGNAGVNPGEQGNALIANAEAYAQSLIDEGISNPVAKIEDKTDKENIKLTPYAGDDYDEYIRMGPFKWEFNGKIDKITLNSENGKVSNAKYSIFKNGKEEFIDISEIPSNKNFYITIKASSNFSYIKNIDVKVKLDTKGICKSDIWFLEHGEQQNLILTRNRIEPVHSEAEANFKYNIKLTKKIKIKKVDSRNKSIPLEGVGFILKNRQMNRYVKVTNGKVTYVKSRDKATEFITNSKGEITVKNLVIATYEAEETLNPHYGYILEDQETVVIGYKFDGVKTITNYQRYIKLSGFIWQDINSGKTTKRNDYYKTNGTPDSEYIDDKDQSFNGIIVRLKDKNGNIVKSGSSTSKELNGPDQETVSGEKEIYSEIDGGEYVFEYVTIDELENYYIEFEYDGLIYQSVIVGDLNHNYSSKATDKVEREILDRNFSSVNATGENRVDVGNGKYSITYNETVDNKTSIKDSSDCILHANTKDAECNIRNYFKPTMEEIKYLNLGLYKKPQADLSLTQDLQNVNIGVNGYWHIYKYAQRTFAPNKYDENDESTWNVGVKFKNSFTGTYKRAVYKADIEYEREDDRNKEIQVYLTYKIALTNESSYITRVNNIVDYYDNRYNIVGVGTGLDGQNNITGDINYQAPQAHDSNNQKFVIDVNSTIQSGETNYIYVQFKLDRAAILQIMNNGETLSNRAEINSYTVFKDNNGNTVAAVDKDSVPGNVRIDNMETYEDDTDLAPAIQLEIANAREIEGTVFVDSTENILKTGQIREGTGIFEDGETTIEGVKVTLHELNNSIPDMETTTDVNGYFKFSEYIPGQYTITYTWGNETYTVQDYKGTIYKEQNRAQRTDVNNNPWYKDETPRYSDAIDNYDTRKNIDEEMSKITNSTINNQIQDAYSNGNKHPDISITTMDSITPTIEFSVEYDTIETNGMIPKNEVKFIVRNVDFGIVERARQQLDMIKRVKNFKITLANGQILVDATVDENGKLQNSQNYVTYMGPSINNGFSDNGFIKAELDNELIEGATLEVGYEIRLINNSEVDYMSEAYYKYGTQTGDIVTITPVAVVDYLDKNLAFEKDKNPDWEQITIDRVKELKTQRIEDVDFLNSRMILYTEKTAIPLKPTETVSVDLNVSKLLTTSSDLAFNNDAETVTIKKPTSPVEQHRGSVVRYFPADSAEEVEVTPSTGDNREYVVPSVIGIVSLIILGGGIVLIKKFVIDIK